MNLSTRPESSRAWVEVNLANLAANARKIQAANPNAKLLPMVKANAYGVGVMEVVHTLESLDPWGFGVATVDEGIELRQLGIARPIVVFTPALADQLDDCRQYDLRPVLDQPALIAAWTRPFHLEIDTGMRRGGIPWNDAAGIATALKRDPEGIFTHFHSADTNESSVAQQLERFNDALQRCGLSVDEGIGTRRTGEHTSLVHVANSAGCLRPLSDHHALVRPGIFLYGGRVGQDQPMPEPVVAVRARVVSIRSLERGDSVSYGADWTAPHATRVATVSIGYADGIRRSSTSGGTPTYTCRPAMWSPWWDGMATRKSHSMSLRPGRGPSPTRY